MKKNTKNNTQALASTPSRGSVYVRSINGGKSFHLYKKQYLNSKPILPHEKLSPRVYHQFQISESMTYAEADQKIKEHRKFMKSRLSEISRQSRAAKRDQNIRIKNQKLFPEKIVDLFIEQMKIQNFGTPEHLNKKIFTFNTAQEIPIELEIIPELYAANAKSIYSALMKRKYSLNYIQKIIALLNEWGSFACERGSGFYKKIPPVPKGQIREKIHESSRNKSKSVRKEGLPMTQMLMERIEKQNKISGIFTEKEINFFKATWAFGLRPEELMNTSLIGKFFKKNTDKKTGTVFITIYQGKLTGVSEEKRFKNIPLKWKEQFAALSIIETQNFSKPSYKSITKMAEIIKCNTLYQKLGLYSGRKGFINWCFDQGETSIHAVASWMGHTDIKITFAIYRDREQVLLGDVSAKKVSGF